MPPERDLHSFLFADLVGFTALTAARGDEVGAAIALDLQHTSRALAAEVGAELVKTMGDAVMVHGHHAGELVWLGLRLAHALRLRPSRQLVRVGVHTGPAIARENDWYGTTVNLAARLASRARAGEVLVSEGTARGISATGALELVDRGVWRPYGAPAPLHVYLARSMEARESELVAVAV
jgi:adenylate cyclase